MTVDRFFSAGARPNSDVTSLTLGARVILPTVDRGRTLVSLNHFRSELGVPGSTAFPSPEARQREVRTIVSARLERPGDRAAWTVQVRELDDRLGFSDLIAQHITDPRGKNAQFPLTDLVRQSIYRRLTGYEDINDAQRLSQDPTFLLIGSAQIWERGAALTSRVHSFETELLTQDENLTGLAAINRALLARVEAMDSSRRVVLDIDSTEIPV